MLLRAVESPVRSIFLTSSLLARVVARGPHMSYTTSTDSTQPLAGNALLVAMSGAIHCRGRPTHARSPHPTACASGTVTIWTCGAGGGVRVPSSC
jgi:hypothetical protein